MTFNPDFGNELGLGVLPPATEKYLISEGYTFASRVFHGDRKYHLRICKGDVRKIATRFVADEIVLLGRQINNTTNTTLSVTA